MAVVSKVPTEVLTEIFYLLCKKPIFVYKLNNTSYNEDFPWAVGLVCQQWRTAFLSYPSIWASLMLYDSHRDSLPTYIIPKTNDEPYAKEINRRLALYLERSGGYPLRLDILLWLSSNQSFTMTALKMLSACSHRWHTAKFDLSDDWQTGCILPCKGKLPTLEWLEINKASHLVRGIFGVAPRLTHAYVGPWAKSSGWILPWTQLTELILTLDNDSVIENGDVPTLLPMLHNIKEFRIRFSDDDVDFEGGFPQFAPTPLNQLRILEVSHPTILSWFEAPSLCEIYFADYQQDYDEPLDVNEQTLSLIQRSSCRISKLSFESGRKFIVGTLMDVEELVINYEHSDGIRSPIDISSLPNLRLLIMICSVDENVERSMDSLTAALKSARVPTRNEFSPGTPISLLKRVMVELQYDRKQPEIPKRLLKIAKEWPVVVFRTQSS